MFSPLASYGSLCAFQPSFEVCPIATRAMDLRERKKRELCELIAGAESQWGDNKTLRIYRKLSERSNPITRFTHKPKESPVIPAQAEFHGSLYSESIIAEIEYRYSHWIYEATRSLAPSKTEAEKRLGSHFDTELKTYSVEWLQALNNWRLLFKPNGTLISKSALDSLKIEKVWKCAANPQSKSIPIFKLAHMDSRVNAKSKPSQMEP